MTGPGPVGSATRSAAGPPQRERWVLVSHEQGVGYNPDRSAVDSHDEFIHAGGIPSIERHYHTGEENQ